MIFDNSRLQTFKDCQLKYYFTNELGLKKIADESEDNRLVFGSAWHKGLETMFLKKGLDASIEAALKVYSEALDSTDLALTPDNLKTTLIAYYKERYADEVQKWDVIDVEQTKQFQLTDSIEFTVRCDMVVKSKQDGYIYGVENKTTSTTKGLSYDYWEQYNPNTQISTQLSYLKSVYGNKVGGIYINAVHFRFLQRKSKNGDAGFHYKFERQLFNQSDDTLAKWKRSALKTISDIKQSNATQEYSYNTGQCRFCKMKKICQAQYSWPEDKDLILIQFTQGDPNAYLKSDVADLTI